MEGELERCREFVARALRCVWEGGDIDAFDAQEWAEELRLVVPVAYDPDQHGESDAEPGEEIFVLAWGKHAPPKETEKQGLGFSEPPTRFLSLEEQRTLTRALLRGK